MGWILRLPERLRSLLSKTSQMKTPVLIIPHEDFCGYEAFPPTPRYPNISLMGQEGEVIGRYF